MLPALSAFQEIEDQSLASVRVRKDEDSPDISALILDFQTLSLLIETNPDDDTVQVSTRPVADAAELPTSDVSDSSLWREFAGQPFGWGWIVVNQQGYSDGILLGFGEISPQLLLEVKASALHVRRIGEDEALDAPDEETKEEG